MEFAFSASKALSIVLFLFYGLSVLLSGGMVAEFERYGLSRFRRLTGALEVLGALGLLVGYWLPPLDILASGGLALLMLLGIATRIRVHDGVLEMLPAVVLMIVNGFVMVVALAR